jgi:hypothetical protein
VLGFVNVPGFLSSQGVIGKGVAVSALEIVAGLIGMGTMVVFFYAVWKVAQS